MSACSGSSSPCLLLSREVCLVSLIMPIWQPRKLRGDVSCPSSCSCRMAEQESVLKLGLLGPYTQALEVEPGPQAAQP